MAQDRALKDGKLNVYWTMCTNNMQAGPNINEERMPGWRDPRNFIIVSDPYPTVSALAADLILPTAMWVEKEGAYGNAERRTQFWRQQVQAPGEAKSDLWQFCLLYTSIGAGGAALKLLQESGIPEAKDYAGFPVGGQFLVSENPDVVNHHLAKVYGKASVGAPPMSVPHIDTRVLDGKRVVLFGPFATFSTKFLKNGSLWDLMSSTTTSNVMPMMHVLSLIHI